MEVHKDAFGRQIIIGHYYGYSIRDNGTTISFYGKAIKVSKGFITIEITKRFEAYHTDNVEEKDITRKTVRVKCNLVFQISNMYHINNW